MRLIFRKTILGLSGSAAIGILSSLICCVNAQAEVFISRYSVSLAGVHIGDAILRTSLEAKTYKVAVSADFSVMLVNTRIAGEASGSRAGAKLAPDHFRMITTGGEESAVETNFAGSRANAKAAQHLRGLLDPLSALLVTSLKPGAASSSCNHVLPVLLGRTRFDLRLYPKPAAEPAEKPLAVTCLAIASESRPGQRDLVMEIGFRKLPKPHVWLVEYLSLPTQNGTLAIERAETAVSGS
jgi:hypothetical protein